MSSVTFVNYDEEGRITARFRVAHEERADLVNPGRPRLCVPEDTDPERSWVTGGVLQDRPRAEVLLLGRTVRVNGPEGTRTAITNEAGETGIFTEGEVELDSPGTYRIRVSGPFPLQTTRLTLEVE